MTHSLVIQLLDGVAEAAEGHTDVHLLDGATEILSVPLEASGRTVVPSSSLTGWLRQQEEHVVVPLLDGAAEAAEAEEPRRYSSRRLHSIPPHGAHEAKEAATVPLVA